MNGRLLPKIRRNEDIFYTKCPPSRSHWEDRNKEEEEEEDQGHEGESEEELSLTFSEVGIVIL